MQGRRWLFVLYLIVSLYLVNMAFNFITLPDVFAQVTKWILVLAAVLIIISGIKFLKRLSYTY